MTEIDFKDFWENEYPESFPISHELKWVYPHRWFRIHSLPNSKRYADSLEEYNVILNRQNNLINDLIGEGTEIAVAFGMYTDDLTNDNYKELADFGKFQKIYSIDLHQERPREYDSSYFLDVFVKIEQWQKGKRNELLKAIADDKIRAMFICPSKQCIVAPYDGGVDIIVESTEKRNQIRHRYKEWLSNRDDLM